MPAIATRAIAAGAIAASSARSKPVGTLTSPSGTLSQPEFTASWTYTSPTSRPQLGYRVRIATLGGSVLFDTGVVAGAATSYASTTLLSSGAYEVWLTVTDGVTTSDVSVASIFVDLPTVEDYPDNPQVGSVYEIALNGVGYMLADSPERPVVRRAGQVQAPRFATGDTPFSEAVDRYTFVGQTDWSGGAGQRHYDRPRSTDTGFWTSQGVNVFDLEGGVELLNDVERMATTTGDTRAVVADGDLYVQTGAQEVKCIQWDGTTTTYSSIGADVVDMASDGHWVYLLTDDATNSIWRGNRGASGFSAWSTGVLGSVRRQIEWCGDRLAVSYTTTSGSPTTGTVSTFSPAGAAESLTVMPATYSNAEVQGMTAGDGYMWFGVNYGADGASEIGERGTVRAWQLGSDTDAPFLALSLPEGQVVRSLYFYLGTVMVAALERAATGYTVHLYRAVPSAGELTPEFVTSWSVASGCEDVSMAGVGRLVLFSWSEMADDAKSGVGALDLSTGGYARWLVAGHASATDEDVRSVVGWRGRIVFTVDGAGAYREDADTLVTSGYVTSSGFDLASSLRKVLDDWRIGTDPLPADAGYTLEVSTSGGATWTTVGSNSSAGSTESTAEVGREAVSFSTRLTLAAASDGTSPRVKVSQQRVHALSLVDQILELPVNCGEHQEGLNGSKLSMGPPATIMRRLEALAGSRVRLQGPDWPLTGVVEVWDVVDVNTSAVGVFDRAVGRRVEAAPVALLTLRRAG